MLLKKNTAGQHVYFAIGYVAGGGAVGETIAAFRSIDGGAQASVTGTIVEDGNGMYHLVTSAADTNGSVIGFYFGTSGSSRLNDRVNVTTVGIVWDELTANHTGAGSTGAAIAAAAAGIVPNTIAAALWNYLTSAMATSGSIGELLKTQLDTNVASRLAEADYLAPDNSTIGTIATSTGNLPGAPAAVSDILSTTQIANAILDEANAIETGWTVRQALKVILAALGGKLSGAATSAVVVRDLNDSKNRISATVDVNGNRSAVTYDKT
jgi:hypothetical protein